MQQPITLPESPYEASRRIGNLLRLGTVAAVRTTHPARCRVACGALTTNWLPWLTLRAAGSAAFWWAPIVGEQCLLLAPGGDLNQGVVLPGLYSDQLPPPAVDDPAHCVLQLGASRITIAPDSIRLEAAGGSLTVDAAGAHGEPDVTSGAISLRHHVHGQVKSGDDDTGAPK